MKTIYAIIIAISMMFNISGCNSTNEVNKIENKNNDVIEAEDIEKEKENVKTEDTETEGKQEKEKIPLYKVVRVVDGDTIIIDYNGKEERVRLIGMDTPESVHPDQSKNVKEGEIASNYVKEMIEGKDVGIELDVQERDHYGRILAYVYLDDIMLNKHLLSEGYARLSTYPPNTKYVDEFTRIESEARENKKGFWSNIDFKSEDPTDSNENGEKTIESNFVGSSNSDKFHKPNCRWAKEINSNNEVWFDSKEDAANNGYVPCKVCKP